MSTAPSPVGTGAAPARGGGLRRMILEAVVIACIAGTAGAAAYHLHPLAPALYLNDEPLAADEVDLAAIAERWNGDVLWIDARPSAEYTASHVPGAIPLNEQDWDASLWEHADALLSSDKPIVVYCGAFACQASRKIADRLRTSVGLPEVYILRGGWKTILKSDVLDPAKGGGG